MNPIRLLVLALLAFSALALPAPSLAQAATPSASPGAASGQMACTAEPRDIDELLALWFTPEGAPLATTEVANKVDEARTLPQGEVVDDATLQAIDQTTRGWVACFIVSGQFARGFSYMTDQMVARFGPDMINPSEDTPEEVAALLAGQLAGTPIPSEEGMADMSTLQGPKEARLLENGRAGALWSLEGDQVFLVYEKHGDRWLIDDLIDVEDVAGTPDA